MRPHLQATHTQGQTEPLWPRNSDLVLWIMHLITALGHDEIAFSVQARWSSIFLSFLLLFLQGGIWCLYHMTELHFLRCYFSSLLSAMWILIVTEVLSFLQALPYFPLSPSPRPWSCLPGSPCSCLPLSRKCHGNPRGWWTVTRGVEMGTFLRRQPFQFFDRSLEVCGPYSFILLYFVISPRWLFFSPFIPPERLHCCSLSVTESPHHIHTKQVNTSKPSSWD